MAPERLVVDANLLFSALLRDGTTRQLILHGGLDLHTPGWLWQELDRNRAFLLEKSKASPAAFDILVASLRDRIRDIPLDTIRPHIDAALARVGKRHRSDAPYVAAAMAIQGGVWSHDKRLARLAGVPVFGTRDLLEL